MSWVRRHLLIIAVCLLAVASFVTFTWAEWHYFLDQASTHKEPLPTFWSAEHLHDWLYNAAANWQSELIFGVLVVVLLHKAEGRKGADKGDT